MATKTTCQKPTHCPAEPMQKAASKSMAGVRSYEFHLKMQFDPSISLTVLHAKQADYGKLFKQRADATKAAQNKAKRVRK